MTTSARNKALAKGIADAFIKGVLQLCKHQDLQYQWMRYLPNIDDESAFDEFWIDFIKRMEILLETLAAS